MGLTEPFGGVYRGARVLITGHTGFKGSWLARWLHRLGARVSGIGLEPATTPSHADLLDTPFEHDLRLDLRDAAGTARAVRELAPEFVFHLAAQALVRRGYAEPVETYSTNVLGLVHLLEAVRTTPSVRVVVNATTDKVYEPQPSPSAHVETDPLGGHDPYSASKACAELVSASYARSWLEAAGVRLATARAGNVIGGGDWAEDRLVPDLVRAKTSGAPVEIRYPSAVRPWQHVLEPLSGYLMLAQALKEGRVPGGAWNFGPATDDSLPVSEIVGAFQAAWPELTVRSPAARALHETAELRLDSTHAARTLGWRPTWASRRAIEATIAWYDDLAAGRPLRTDVDIDAHFREAKRQGAAWAT